MEKEELKLLKQINDGIQLNNKLLSMFIEIQSSYAKTKVFDTKVVSDIEFDRKIAAFCTKKAELFKHQFDENIK